MFPLTTHNHIGFDVQADSLSILKLLALRPLGAMTLKELDFFIYHGLCDQVEKLLSVLTLNNYILIDGKDIWLTELGFEYLEEQY